MVKPTIVFIPGAWHTPDIYKKTRLHLASHGYQSVDQELPSCGVVPGHSNFDQDVAAIRQLLTQLVVDMEAEVILVSHSWSGIPASEAVDGLGKKQREEKGQKGGILRLVYVMALVMPEGFAPTAGGAQFPDWMKVDAQNNVINVTAEDARHVFYNDLSETEANSWAEKLQPQSLGVYDSKVTHAGWRYIPSTFVAAGQDKTAITPEVVDYMITSARSQVPEAMDVVERHPDAGHCLMLSQPKWLADVLRRAAGEQI